MKKYFKEHKAAVILAIIVILLIIGIGSCSIAQSAAQQPADEGEISPSSAADELADEEPVADADELADADSEADAVLVDTSAGTDTVDTEHLDEPKDTESAEPTSTPSPTAKPTEKPAETSSTAAKSTAKATATPKPAAKETAKATATTKPAATEAPKATATPKPTEKPKVWVVDQAAWTETIEHKEEGHWEKKKVGSIDYVKCNGCGAEFGTTSEVNSHWKQYFEQGEDHGGWSGPYSRGKFEDVWVVDKAAWTETIHHEEVGHWE